MKFIFTFAAVACAFALHAAPQVTTLVNGDNFVNTAGEIVGVECMTVDAAQVVTASVECSVTEMTNTYKQVTTPHMRYDLVLTNWNGSASVSTNVFDNFNYSDWVVLGTNHLVSVSHTSTNITETVADGKRPGATFTKETAIGSGTASSHYLLITPASTMNFFGGKIKVSCGDGDIVRILVK